MTASEGPELDGLERLDSRGADASVEKSKLSEALAGDDRSVIGAVRRDRAQPPRADEIEAVADAPGGEDDGADIESFDLQV